MGERTLCVEEIRRVEWESGVRVFANRNVVLLQFRQPGQRDGKNLDQHRYTGLMISSVRVFTKWSDPGFPRRGLGQAGGSAVGDDSSP